MILGSEGGTPFLSSVSESSAFLISARKAADVLEAPMCAHAVLPVAGSQRKWCSDPDGGAAMSECQADRALEYQSDMVFAGLP